ncbi:hypothetical protein AN3896.2 [Aspergillus nidulans FGSC A4]|uniref:Fumarylacetoacetase-like C-terminal domain-containing protein n=1 Tax=Emericella nidulans (strain FGSC A4 / ATCC 38163 / CBS 112.46 / NRRL 194 / M139) TaxID=227321 RepID=Q5B6D4_EMENI|nr:hypothetical protein [Aspergillus nidulans FGSC A4]EAA58827.1 hypothetical protein AN3896.2 [Aspergillus nidulans FGSC A4]CBF75148.1 TPA: conserved hypothetical protein [Aspergillus nidulans FGSC A4]|eukprot:XP_661500.1 hypothetical protein AN3896.2 [Aspergillus nidulans FGSC A4]
MKLDIPTVPTLFLKPSTSLGDPYPTSSTILPKITQEDGTGDYESEMAIIIGQDAKDVSEEEALDYVLGYTAANDISSRTSQMNQSQWCFSKGFDGACPLGPVVGTTLPAGTVILTGTPPGVGAAKNPKEFLRDGDEFRVELLPFVGTLVSKIKNQV